MSDRLFIELTESAGNQLLVNVDHIIFITTDPGALDSTAPTFVRLSDGNSTVYVKEDKYAILETIGLRSK